MELGIFKVTEKAITPSKGTTLSSCYDLSVCLHNEFVDVYQKGGKTSRRVDNVNGQKYVVVHPNERVILPTGLIFDIPEGHDIKVYSRSGLSIKNGIRLSNNVAVIDNDYKDELFVLITNDSQDTFKIDDEMRVAQFELTEILSYDIKEVSEKPTLVSDRKGGLGSTGTSNKKTIVKKEGV